MSANHNDHVLELVTFKLKPGATEDAFASANESLAGWLSRQPGFVSRNLSHNEKEDTYIDVVYWESLAAVEMANQLAMTAEECAPLFSMCDIDTVKMVHAMPVTSVVPV